MRTPTRLEETRPTGNGRARGLVSSRDSGRRVESRRFAASEALSDLVETFWIGRWDLRGQAPHETELLSDPCVNFVFEEGGRHAGSRVVGVWTRLWRRTLEGQGFVRGVKLRAGAVRAFVRDPAHRFSNRVTPLASVFGSQVAKLERAVLDPQDDGEALGNFEAWLVERRIEADAPSIRLAIALVDRIAKDPEITTVERLAAVAGVGSRSLQRLFRDFVGASPKWVIRRNRLQEVASRLERGQAPTLTALAATLGYSDQAHLARDFKSVVGKSPSDFAASVRTP
jgi:AraC-like DNA-binding protein